MDEDKKSEIKELLAKITKLIEEVLDEKDTVEEISTGVGPGGAPMGLPFLMSFLVRRALKDVGTEPTRPRIKKDNSILLLSNYLH